MLVIHCSCTEFLFGAFPKRAACDCCSVILPDIVMHRMNGFEVPGHGK